MLKHLVFGLILFVTASSGAQTAASSSAAKVQIDVDQAKVRKSLIAFPSLQFFGSPSSSPNFNSVGSELYRTISNNLTVTSFFQFVNPSAFLEDTTKVGLKPAPGDANGFKFDSWKQIGAEFLIRGGFSLAGNDLTLEVYVYNVTKADLVFGKKYRGTTEVTRRIAHTFSNDLMEALTGVRGMFLSRAVFTSDRGGGGYREVYIMDWDGMNVEKLTNHRSVSLSPAISPDGTKVAYTAFVQRARTKTRNADLFLYDLQTAKRWLISYRQGINSGAFFSPDNEHIFLTISQGGSPDIYKIKQDGSMAGRVTNGPRGSMNVEPAVSPDGRKIAFSSDRSGQPMIYIANVDGSNPKRMTFAGRYNSTPSWSPDGKKLAFSGWENDHFDIFTMDADGTNMVRITSSRKPNGKWANNEDPVWSPDGRFLMYTSNRTGSSQIYISNLDGSEERRITSDSFNYFKPRWSKNLD
ncbi:MAG: translocation protein TolB [Pseudobdellovibrionaceae bacterium]|jgi:TolB protein